MPIRGSRLFTSAHHERAALLLRTSKACPTLADYVLAVLAGSSALAIAALGLAPVRASSDAPLDLGLARGTAAEAFMTGLFVAIGMSLLSAYGGTLAIETGHPYIAAVFGVVAGVWLASGINGYRGARR